MEETTNELGDTELVQRLQLGDESAFEQLYRRHVGAIHALCWRLTADTTEAEEMTQEVFFRAWKHGASISSGDHLRGWLRRVAVNLRRSVLRSEKRRGPVFQLDEDGRELPGRPDPPPGLRSELDQAIAALPKGARDVLVLHDVYGYRHGEISEMLGIAVGTCRAHLHRARKKLQEVLS